MNAADIAFIKILAVMLILLFALITWALCVVASEEMAQRRKEDPEDDRENRSCHIDADL